MRHRSTPSTTSRPRGTYPSRARADRLGLSEESAAELQAAGHLDALERCAGDLGLLDDEQRRAVIEAMSDDERE